MATRIEIREDIAASWTVGNKVLTSGEIGYEKDTSRIKIGDGGTPWTGLLYLGQTAPGLLPGFTFAQATNDTSALAVANKYSQIVVSDRGAAGKPAYSDGVVWRFYNDDLAIS